ncbi:hypothetical protein RB593_001949 [Gaeumannomyces tritici]
MSKSKGKGRSKRGEKPLTYTSSTQAEYQDMMSTFPLETPGYTPDTSVAAGSSSAGTTPQTASSHDEGGVIRNPAIESSESVELSGPMEVDGSVKSGGSVAFYGDFSVRERIEAYGDIALQGNMTCNDRVKTMGSMRVTGDALFRSKVEVYGTLEIVGNVEIADTIEVWGAVSIHGHLKCRTLVAYSSVTTVGDESSYEAEEGETIWGARMIKRYQI